MVLLHINNFFVLFCVLVVTTKEEQSDVGNLNQKVSENRLSAQILAYLDHYKQNDPVGLPMAPIPDPMAIPDVKQTITMATLTMQNILAYGLSKFRIKHVHADLQKFKVVAKIQLDEMNVVGKYTLATMFSRADGPFKVVLRNVHVTVDGLLAVGVEGNLHTDTVKMDIHFSDMSSDFKNLGFLASIFQGIINSAPNLIFDAIKPFILEEAYKRIQNEIDTEIEKLSSGRKFPNSISPLDMAIAEARKYVRSANLDPYHLRDYNHTVGVCTMKMKNTWITGLSSFYRYGNVSLTVDNHVITAQVQIGTQKIVGSSQWEVSLGSGVMSKSGRVQFQVDHIKASLTASQPMDTRKHPVLKDLQLEVGNIQVRCDGAGTMDYLVELVINLLPNLLRYQIMDAIENPIRLRIQERLNQLDIEELIRKRLQELEENGFETAFNFGVLQ